VSIPYMIGIMSHWNSVKIFPLNRPNMIIDYKNNTIKLKFQYWKKKRNNIFYDKNRITSKKVFYAKG